MTEKLIKEHYMKHQITEWEHIPDHEQRKETLEFKNSKRQLEKIEHLNCYVCGTDKNLEAHHIFERCWANALDMKKIAYMLFHHFDFHNHCHRDFQNEDELYQFLMNYESAELALDSLYNMLIVCKAHHRDEGHSVHGASFATFCALLADKDDQFKIALSPKEYEEIKNK